LNKEIDGGRIISLCYLLGDASILLVDGKLLKDINSRRLEEKGYIHGKG